MKVRTKSISRKHRLMIGAGLLALAIGGISNMPRLARSDSPPPAAAPIRVAVANPVKIFGEMQEKKDAQARVEAQGKDLEEEMRNRARDEDTAHKDLLGNGVRPGSPAYKEAQAKFIKLRTDNQVWLQVKKEQLMLQQKEGYRDLYKKIEDAAQVVAKQKGYDLVLSDSRAPFPDDMSTITVEQVLSNLNQRTILYKSDAIDITQDILVYLDSQYQASHK